MDQEFPPDPSTNPLEISEEELSESAEPMDMDGDLEEYDSNAEAETQSLQEFLDQEMEERQPSDMDELDSVHESQLDPTAGEQFMSSNEASPRISVVEVEEMGDVDIEQSYAQDDTILSAETNGPDSPEKPGSPLLEFVSPPAEAVASPSRPVSPVRVASPVKEDVKPETPLKPVSPVKEAVSVASPVREPARSVSPVREVVTPVKPASPVREVVTPVKPASPIREVVTSVKPASPVKAVSPVRVSSPAKDEEMKQASPIREPARLVSPEKAVSPVREAVQPATPLKAAVSPVREASPVRETAKLPERRQEITPKQTTASLNVPGITRSDIKVTASPINLSPTQTNAQTANVLKSVIAETPSKSSSPIIFKPTAVDLQTSEMAQIAKQTGFDLSLHSIIGLPKQHPVLDQLFKHLLKNANDKDTINALQSKNKRLEAEKQLAETNLKEQAKEFQQQTRELKQQLTESKHQNQKQHDLMSALSKQIDLLKSEVGTKDALLKNVKDKNTASDSSYVAFQEEKKTLTNMIVKKQEEVNQLSEELEYSKSQIVQLRSELRQQSEKITEMQTSDMQVRSALLSSEQELKQSKKMIEWCNEELDRKNDHFQEYRREKQDQVAKLQTELETMTQDKTSLESRNQSLQKRTKELDERLQQSLQKAMDLENRLIVNEQHFRNEMNSQKKLTELYQSKSQELSKQLESFEHLTHDLEHQLLNMRESSQEEQQELLTELETLREKRQEQEQEIDRLKQELANVNQTLEQNNALDAIGTLSETAAAAGKLQKSGKTFTQVYAEYSRLQTELVKEKAETARLTETLNRIVSEIEQRGPLIQQTRLDYERAKQENERLSTDLAVALHNRNESLEALKQLQREMSALEQEKTLVEQDCRDVKRQIQTLLVQMEQIAPSMSAQVDRSAFVVHEQDDLSPAEQLIQDRLVIFKNVEELQNQNLQLRRSLRSLAQQMESLEQQHRDEQAQTESILEAARLVHQLQEELKEKTLQLESFARERDQWKHIANARTKSPTKEKSETDPDYQMLYKDCQHEFEVYRKETTNDIDLLKKEAYALQQDKMNLSVQVAKVNNQLSYMEERYQLLSKTCDDQTNEMEQLRKRLSHVGPLTAKQDARIEELNNTLLSIRQDLEQQRNENQQLKIEQHVWKASEARALKEAQDLLRERNTSNERLRTMQQQLEDKERQHEQHLQKSEERLEQLTRELQLTRKQLSELMDDHRSLGSRRESELKESQIKIERLTSDHERAKGELLALESKEQLLQTRVQELQTRLQHAEDKLNVYEGRQLNLQSMGSSGNNQSRELDLALAQARIDLESTKQELQVQVEQVEQFKSISQASEERLIELNATYDLYKQEIEKEKQALEQKIANLEQESTQLKKDLQEALNEVFKTQEKLDSIAGEHAKQVSGLLAEKEQLKAGHDLAVKAKMDMKADMERQERLMKDAQESYEREVVAHSNALQAVNTLKQQVFETRQKIQESELKAQNAQQLLEKHKESSKTIQQKLEEQNHQLQIRVEDLVAQNNLIHAQFEQFSVARQPVVGEEKPLKDMQEVIKFLRREKEIVEAQLQLALHEQERQKVQTEHLQKSLDETRFLLEEERKRSSNGDLQEKHQELMERIEQANLLRESNVTLRVQLEESVQKLKTLEKRLLQAEGQVGPLKEQVLLLEAEVEARKQQAQQLQQDNERWKARSQQILQKYERIDPQEHQRLKQDVELLSNQKQELEKQLQERTAEHEKMMAELRKKNLNINEVAKKYKDSAQNKQQTIVSMKEQLDTKDLEIKQLKESTQVSSGLQQQLNAIREERDQQIAKYNLFAQKNKEKQQELEQQIQTLKTSMQQQGLEKDKLQQTHQQELDQAKKESEKHSARSNLLQAQLNKVRQENVRLQELTSDTSTKRARETDAAVEVQRAQSPKRQRVVEDKPKQVKKILQKQQKEAAPTEEKVVEKEEISPIVFEPTPMTVEEKQEDEGKPEPKTAQVPKTPQAETKIPEKLQSETKPSEPKTAEKITPIVFEPPEAKPSEAKPAEKITPIIFEEPKPAEKITPIVFEEPKPVEKIIPIIFEATAETEKKEEDKTTLAVSDAEKKEEKITPIVFDAAAEKKEEELSEEKKREEARALKNKRLKELMEQKKLTMQGRGKKIIRPAKEGISIAGRGRGIAKKDPQ